MSPPPQGRRGAHLVLFFIQFLFATMPVAGKRVLEEFEPLATMGLRVTFAALIFVTFAAARGLFFVPAPRDLARLALYSLFGIMLNQTLFLEGLSRTTAANAAILMTTIPVFTILVARLLGRERIGRRRGIGLAIALSGALLVTGVERFSLQSSYALGNLLILLNCLCYGTYLVLSRDILVRMNAVNVVAWLLIFGAIGVQPLTLGPALAQLRAGGDAGTWLALAWIVLGGTLLAYFLNAWALRRVPASVVGAYTNLQPVLAVLLAVLLLGEAPSARTLLAGALILFGVLLVGRPAREAKPPAVQPMGRGGGTLRGR